VLAPPNTPRPEFVVDAWAFRLYDPTTKTYVGRAAEWGRQRVVSAIELNGGPQQVYPPKMVNDPWGFALADPNGNIIGKPGVTISRILSATWTHDTRRL
jgi:hypothetical protein